MNLIFAKIALPLALFVGGMVGGIFLQQRVLSRPVVCPACNCPAPPPSASIQPFDVGKMKKVKGFNYSPQFTGNISVAALDSASISKIINEAIDRNFKKYGERKGLFRK